MPARADLGMESLCHSQHYAVLALKPINFPQAAITANKCQDALSLCSGDFMLYGIHARRAAWRACKELDVEINPNHSSLNIYDIDAELELIGDPLVGSAIENVIKAFEEILKTIIGWRHIIGLGSEKIEDYPITKTDRQPLMIMSECGRSYVHGLTVHDS